MIHNFIKLLFIKAKIAYSFVERVAYWLTQPVELLESFEPKLELPINRFARHLIKPVAREACYSLKAEHRIPSVNSHMFLVVNRLVWPRLPGDQIIRVQIFNYDYRWDYLSRTLGGYL